MSWLQRRRAAKCKALGHREVVRERRAYRMPKNSWRSVADCCRERRVVCRRCKDEVSPWEVVERRSLDGLTMNAADWDELRATGYLVIEP